MGYRASDSYCVEFITSISGGAAANADALPVATANHNGTDDGTFTLTVANLDAGRYKVTGTIPAGYVGGDVLNVTVAATIQTVLTKAKIDTQVIDRIPTATPANFSALVISAGGLVKLDLTQALSAARALDAIADTSVTVNDALQCAAGSITAQLDASSGTTLVIKTASTGQTLRTKNLTNITPPATVPSKAV